MSDQCNVRYLLEAIGDKKLSEITQNDYDLLSAVISDIKDHPHRGKVIYDYIHEYKSEQVSPGNILSILLESCEEIDEYLYADENATSLETFDNNADAFKIVDSKSGARAIIYASGTETPWGTASGMTQSQIKLLKSLRIKEIKWYKVVGGEYVPTSNKYVSVESIKVVPIDPDMGKEVAILCASLVGLMAFCAI